jgi:hypothetical protein
MTKPGGRAAAAALMVLLTLFWAPAPRPLAEEEAIAPEDQAVKQAGPITLERVIELLRNGIPSPGIVTMIQRQGGAFQLTVDDVVRLRKIGASPALILAMSAGVETARDAAAALEETPPARPGRLTPRDVTRALQKGADPAEVARRIETEGMRRPPDLDDLSDLAARGVPPEVLRAMARGATAPAEGAAASATPAATAPAASGPLTLEAILELIKADMDEAADVIREKGVARPLTLDEVLKLRAAGADDEVMVAVREAGNAVVPPSGDISAVREQDSGEETPEEPPSDFVAVPWKRSYRSPSHVPTPASEDRLWIASVPSDARVYLATSRTRPADVFERDHYVGRTPLSLTLPPGEYDVVVQHEAGEFEAGLAPGWRTVHDGTATRSLLDNADLTFDPAACCLPGSLEGQAELRPVPRDMRRALIGDSFDGLPPFLFDGERLQVLRVRDTRITHTMKLYRVRKSPGRSRLLVSTFLPSEGDPLDLTEQHGLPPGTPYDEFLDVPSLDYLRDGAQLPDVASALGVETSHLGEAVAMLRRAGKSILHQQIEGGLRLMTLALDDQGQIRWLDRSLHPTDLFAAPAPPPKKKKKVKPVPPPPLLAPAERVVVPGLGPPSLSIDNRSGKPIGLLLEDGQLCWVPAGQRREFAVDPGTFEARVLGPGYSDMNPAPRGQLHFSFNARYALTF